MEPLARPMDKTAFTRRLDELNAAIQRTKALVAASRLRLAKAADPGAAAPAVADGAGAAPRGDPATLAASPPVSTDAAFARFSELLDERGLRDALAYLVGLSDYRFIGIFRFENGMANAAVHVDRLNPDRLTVDEVPDTATYCGYVRDAGHAFATEHAALDERLDAHVARDAVPAYCGVPVMDPEGRVLGTLCHYDLVPRDPEQLDLFLLVRVASAIEQSGKLPPYPRRSAPAA